MSRLIGRVAVAAGLAALPATVLAQGAPRHEFGVDLAMAFQSVSSLGGAGSTTLFAAATPVDVRIGWVSPTPLSLEGRLTFNFNSRGFGSNASYALAPDVNVLYKLGGNAAAHRLTGPYLTGGLGLELANAPNGTGGTNSGLVPSLNGGIGTRWAAGTGGAWRLEGFLAYAFENTKLGSPATLSIGARIGLSLWH